MVQQSQLSLREMAYAEKSKYLNVECNAGNKPRALIAGCTLCDFIVYVDTDAVWTGISGVFDATSNLINSSQVSILAGIDYPETMKVTRSEHKSGFYPGLFNNGILALRCTKITRDILEQWRWLLERLHEDQRALQEMAEPQSVFHANIKYDFMTLGVYSKYIHHFPGAYKNQFKYTRHSKFMAPRQTIRCPTL